MVLSATMTDHIPDLEYFKTIPWTSKLLAHPDFTAIPTPSRKWKQSTECAVISETLNTKDTIRAWLLLLKKKQDPDEPLIKELHSLLSLGYAINGFPGLAHGGIIGLVIDETMGMLLEVNALAGNADMGSFVVTAYLKTTFIKPVPTSAVVMVTTQLRERVGRKIYIDATVEDEGGDVLATGEALWIHTKELKANL